MVREGEPPPFKERNKTPEILLAEQKVAEAHEAIHALVVELKKGSDGRVAVILNKQGGLSLKPSDEEVPEIRPADRDILLAEYQPKFTAAFAKLNQAKDELELAQGVVETN